MRGGSGGCRVGLRRARMTGTSMALKAARRASAVWRWRVGGMVAATGCGPSVVTFFFRLGQRSLLESEDARTKRKSPRNMI